MTVRRSAVLPVEPARLWEAITDDELLSRWFGADVTLDPRPGGRGTFRGPQGTRTARVTGVEQERRLAFAWDDEPDAGVDLTLEPVEGGTRLDVVETPPATVAAPEASAAAATAADEQWTDWDMRLVVLCEAVPALTLV